MKLEAKITKENLDLITSGKKTIELRGIEFIDLKTDNETRRFRVVEIAEAHQQIAMRNCFPQYLGEKDLIVFIQLGEELDMNTEVTKK